MTAAHRLGESLRKRACSARSTGSPRRSNANCRLANVQRIYSKRRGRQTHERRSDDVHSLEALDQGDTALILRSALVLVLSAAATLSLASTARAAGACEASRASPVRLLARRVERPYARRQARRRQQHHQRVRRLRAARALLDEPRGFSGESLNVYDPARKVWHQTWVDNSGTLLLIEGGVRGKDMVLEGETTRRGRAGHQAPHHVHAQRRRRPPPALGDERRRRQVVDDLRRRVHPQVSAPSEAVVDSRVALVTGANRGLGLETARQLLARGLRVVLAGRDPRAMEEARRSLAGDGANAMAVRLDVTDAASIAAAARSVGERWGGVDVLVNNAAILLEEDAGVLSIPGRALPRDARRQPARSDRGVPRVRAADGRARLRARGERLVGRRPDLDDVDLRAGVLDLEGGAQRVHAHRGRDLPRPRRARQRRRSGLGSHRHGRPVGAAVGGGGGRHDRVARDPSGAAGRAEASSAIGVRSTGEQGHRKPARGAADARVRDRRRVLRRSRRGSGRSARRRRAAGAGADPRVASEVRRRRPTTTFGGPPSIATMRASSTPASTDALDWPALVAHVEAISRGERSEPFRDAFEALRARQWDRLSSVIEQHPDLVRARGTNGNSLLNLAVSVAGSTLRAAVAIGAALARAAARRGRRRRSRERSRLDAVAPGRVRQSDPDRRPPPRRRRGRRSRSARRRRHAARGRAVLGQS